MSEQAPAPAPRKQVNMADVMQPGVLLIIAGLIALIAGAGSQLITTILVALIMLYAGIVSFGYITILRDLVQILSVSAVTGIILFFTGIEQMARFRNTHWSVIVGFIAGLIALFAAFVGYFKPSFAKK